MLTNAGDCQPELLIDQQIASAPLAFTYKHNYTHLAATNTPGHEDQEKK